MNIEEQRLDVYCYITPSGIPVDDFFFKFKFEKEEFVYSNTLRALEVLGSSTKQHWFLANGTNKDVEDVKTHVPFKTFKYFIGEDSSVNV